MNEGLEQDMVCLKPKCLRTTVHHLSTKDHCRRDLAKIEGSGLIFARESMEFRQLWLRASLKNQRQLVYNLAPLSWTEVKRRG